MYLAGVSVRRVEDITEAMWGTRVSPSTVSNFNKKMQGFVDYHQLPFRNAFPKRKGGGQWDEIADMKARHGGGHYIRIGDGPYSVTGGCEIIKRSDTAKGFEVLPRRWVVERTFAWLGRSRRLAKDWEKSIASAEAWVFVAHIRILIRRLARYC